MKFFDTHAHIGLINEDPIEQLIIIHEAKHEKVEHIVSICNSLHDFFIVYENLKTATNIYHSIGVSPSEVAHPGKDWEQKIDLGVKYDRIVAIGEIGLDYYRKFGDKKSQIELFIKQLEMAQQYNLPVIIHNRDAGNDVFEILKQKLPPRGGILHCFSEDWEYAKKALDLNLFISFAGNVTYRNAKNLHDTVKNMPIERMLVETESPFMVPSGYKGKRNKPAYIHSTVEFIAELVNLDVEEAADIFFKNSLGFFGIEEK